MPACIDTAFILRGSGDRSLYVTAVDKAGRLRNYNGPEKTLADYYQPDPATANDRVYSDVQRERNYPVTCRRVGRNAGDYYGGWQSNGSPTENPAV
ncbi:hypothetical protein CGRA01v4_06820 [Colletotrichum graminicola]|uniref:Uncharacterized protein n=1 Tax=Colletotrichum graminicola (strain M1.001 / M2 / FGSC 10212) TaxID=645133 RepID=E3Q2U4_COLGM|nr:uncharacterized protein GLRG_00067 [Colletotrichum graminicola M1.001]EFQ24923.1 hypothetical protein GLRG_00067 [Colletotrichum graminicola M1.001]WDK15539.1 hypothetical protein CGRA01v4_06820 [Colletotrichum graminicola]